MKRLLFIIVGMLAMAMRGSAEQPVASPLAGRVFSIEDEWAGQELAFQAKGGALVAIWRVLGSGRPVIFEVECAVEIKSSRCVEFDLSLRDRSRGKVKVLIDERAEVRAFLNGIRIFLEEKKADPVGTDNERASPARV